MNRSVTAKPALATTPSACHTSGMASHGPARSAEWGGGGAGECSMRIVGVAVLAGLGMAVAGGGVVRAAPSFDCRAAGTPVERAICADEALGTLDRRIAEAYAELMGAVGDAERARLRAGQREWLTTVRNACAGRPAPGACLAQTMQARAGDLEAAVEPAYAALADLVRSIPDRPGDAAAALAERRGPPGQAWLAYVRRYGPRPDPAAAAATLSGAIGGLTDSFPASIAADQDLNTDEGFLTALRLVNDVYGTAIPCFVLLRHGEAAWDAVQPIYGSSRDGAAPMPDCPADGGPFDTAAWQAVSALIDPLVGTAYGRTGTIRSTFGRAIAVTELRAAVDPGGFRDAGTLDEAVAIIRAWRNPRWVGGGWQERFTAVLDGALREVETVMATRHGLAPEAARTAARGAVGAVLLITAEFVADTIDLESDTRVPDWLHGTRAWTLGGGRGAGEAPSPFNAAQGRLTIAADRLCVAGAGECHGPEAGPAEDDARTALLAAARGAAPPAAPAAPLDAVTVTVGETPDVSFDALRLADGSVLVRMDGTPPFRLTPVR